MTMPKPDQVLLDGPIPKHAQLRGILMGMAQGDLRPDTPIPSERELMVRFGVSRATVREAVGQLVSEGRLYRIHGKGTFVARPRVESTLHLASFTEDMKSRGFTPQTRVLLVDEVTASADVAPALGIDEGDRVWQIVRLRLADGEPMAVESAYYPVAKFPHLDRHDLADSLYTLFSQQFGLTIDSGDQTVWSEAATSDEARLLDVQIGAPLMVFRRVSSAGDQPVEYVTSWYRGDRYQVRMSLNHA